jgi:hypothetical protein
MDTNPFATMIHSIRDDNKKQIPSYYRLGTVMTVTPFCVDVGGASQDENALLKNDMLTNFEVNDRLLLIPIDDEQRYIIVCKVVAV